MGANVSTTKHTTDLSSVQKTISNSIQTSKNTIGSSQFAKAKLNVNTGDITFDGAGSDCNFKFMNSSNVKQIITAKLNASQVSDLRSNVQSNLESLFSKQAKQVSDFGGSSNVDYTSEKIKEGVKSITENTISETNMNKIAESMVIVTETSVTFGNLTCKNGAKGTIIVDNKLIANQTADAVIKSLQENINSNSTLNSLQSKFNEVVDQKNQGIFGTLQAWFKTLGMIGIVIGVVAIIIVLALLFFLLSPAGQKATTNMSSAAAKAAIVA